MDYSINLNDVIEKHRKWLNDKPDGERWVCSVGANLSHADLSGADLSGANLRRADLSDADLSGADLSDADLNDADLSGANLSGANLSGADLSHADLSHADLSGAKNLLNPIKWMSDNFEHDDLGFIVYKGFGNTQYSSPDYWAIEPNTFIEEVANLNPTTLCGCGVNFAPLAWVKSNYENSTVWRCRIRWMDCVGVVVPYGTDGKARCFRLELLEVVS